MKYFVDVDDPQRKHDQFIAVIRYTHGNTMQTQREFQFDAEEELLEFYTCYTVFDSIVGWSADAFDPKRIGQAIGKDEDYVSDFISVVFDLDETNKKRYAKREFGGLYYVDKSKAVRKIDLTYKNSVRFKNSVSEYVRQYNKNGKFKYFRRINAARYQTNYFTTVAEFAYPDGRTFSIEQTFHDEKELYDFAVNLHVVYELISERRFRDIAESVSKTVRMNETAFVCFVADNFATKPDDQEVVAPLLNFSIFYIANDGGRYELFMTEKK